MERGRVLITMTSALLTINIFILISISKPSIVYVMLFTVTRRRAVVVCLKMCEYKSLFRTLTRRPCLAFVCSGMQSFIFLGPQNNLPPYMYCQHSSITGSFAIWVEGTHYFTDHLQSCAANPNYSFFRTWPRTV